MVHYFHSLNLPFRLSVFHLEVFFNSLHCKVTYTESKTEENTSGSFVATTPSEKVPALTF